jgi:hypothetical protein
MSDVLPIKVIKIGRGYITKLNEKEYLCALDHGIVIPVIVDETGVYYDDDTDMLYLNNYRSDTANLIKNDLENLEMNTLVQLNYDETDDTKHEILDKDGGVIRREGQEDQEPEDQDGQQPDQEGQEDQDGQEGQEGQPPEDQEDQEGQDGQDGQEGQQGQPPEETQFTNDVKAIQDEDDIVFEIASSTQVVQSSMIVAVANTMKRVGDLIPEGKNELDTLLKRQLLENMVLKANQELDMDIGSLLYHQRGLPSWLIPVVLVSKRPYDSNVRYAPSYNWLSKFESEGNMHPSIEKAIILDPVVPVPTIVSQYRMLTDQPYQPPGGWTRERPDHTRNMILLTEEENLRRIKMTDVLNQINDVEEIKLSEFEKEYELPKAQEKFKMKQYNMEIKLKPTAAEKLKNAQNANKSRGVYSRLIANPTNIESFTTDNTYESFEMYTIGLVKTGLTRKNGRVRLTELANMKPLETFNTKIHSDANMTQMLTKYYPKIEDVLKTHARYLRKKTNLSSVSRLLQIYNYNVNDMSLSDSKLMIDSLKPITDQPTDWPTRQMELIKPFSVYLETKDRPLHPNDDIDNGRYHYCKLLEEYVKPKDNTDLIRNNTIPLSPTPNGHHFEPETDVIHIHERQPYYKYEGMWYTAKDYNTMVTNEAYRIYNELVSSQPDYMTVSDICKQLAYSYVSIENIILRFSQGAIDKVSGPVVPLSKEAQQLLNFDLSDPYSAQIFKAFLDTYVTNGVITDGIKAHDGFYRVNFTSEIICCRHVYDELRGIDLTSLADTDGQCIYCGAQLFDQLQKDDFNQLGQTTDRSMIYFDEDEPEQEADTRILELLTYTVLTDLNKKLAPTYNIVPKTHETIMEEVKEYVQNNYPGLVDPYQTDNLSKPIGAQTLKSSLYNNKSKPGEFTGNTSILDYTDSSTFAVADNHIYNIYGLNISKTLPKSLMTKEKCSKCGTYNVTRKKKKDGPVYGPLFCTSGLKTETEHVPDCTVFIYKNIYALSMLKPIAELYGIIVAFAIKHLNDEYQTNTSDAVLAYPDIPSIINQYHDVMIKYIDSSIPRIRKSSIESRLKDFNISRLSTMRNLFTGKTSDTLVKSGILGDFNATEHMTMTCKKITGSFGIDTKKAIVATKGKKKAKKALLMENPLAVFEANYKGLYVNSDQVTDIDVDDPMQCLARNIANGSKYCVRLWEHYANVLNPDSIASIDLLPMNNADKSMGLSNLLQYGIAADANMTDVKMTKDQSTFYAALAYSYCLLYNQHVIGRADISETLKNYVHNEETLSKYRDDISLLETVEEPMEKSDDCEWMIEGAGRVRNRPFKKEPEYHLNKSKSLRVTNITVRKQSTKPAVEGTLEKRLALLFKYSKESFESRQITLLGVFNANSKLLESTIGLMSVNTIFEESQSERKIVDRQIVEHFKNLAVKESSRSTEAAELLGFNPDTWPLSTTSMTTETRAVTLARRKITRIQQTGNMMKRYLNWIASEKQLETMINDIDMPIGRKSYTQDETILDTAGYYSPELFAMRDRKIAQKYKMHQFDHFLPEIYTMSYSQFNELVGSNKQLLEALTGSQDAIIQHSHFMEVLTAAIRLDFLLHHNFVMSSIDPNFNVKSVESYDSTKVVNDPEYAAFLDEFFKAISLESRNKTGEFTDYLDPDRSEIDKYFEIRFKKEISRRMTDGKKGLAEGGITILEAPIALFNVDDVVTIEKDNGEWAGSHGTVVSIDDAMETIKIKLSSGKNKNLEVSVPKNRVAHATAAPEPDDEDDQDDMIGVDRDNDDDDGIEGVDEGDEDEDLLLENQDNQNITDQTY